MTYEIKPNGRYWELWLNNRYYAMYAHRQACHTVVNMIKEREGFDD